MDKWIDYEFESSSSLTPEFKQFYMDYRKHLNKLAKGVGIEVKKWSRGHFEISGFFYNPTTSKYAYFNTGDVRYSPSDWLQHTLIRTAESDTDYRGGMNNYSSLAFLASRALELTQ